MSTSPLLLHIPLVVTVLRGVSGGFAGLNALADGAQSPDPEEVITLLEAALVELRKPAAEPSPTPLEGSSSPEEPSDPS